MSVCQHMLPYLSTGRHGVSLIQDYDLEGRARLTTVRWITLMIDVYENVAVANKKRIIIIIYSFFRLTILFEFTL